MAQVDFEVIRTQVQAGDYEISVHAFERMRQRSITMADLENAIIHGDIIERDPQAKPFPSAFSGVLLYSKENQSTSSVR